MMLISSSQSIVNVFSRQPAWAKEKHPPALPAFSSYNVLTFPNLKTPLRPKDTVRFGYNTSPTPATPPEYEEVPFALEQDYKRRFLRAAQWGGFNEANHGNLAVALGRFLMDIIAPWFKEGKPQKHILPSQTVVLKTRKIAGNTVETTAKSLMGAESIFYQWIDTLKNTKKYAMIALYDFDNLKVAGGANPDGAQSQLAWHLQQEILGLVEKKAREGVKFKILLDNSVQYLYDVNGRPLLPRPKNNSPMLDYLQQLNEKIKTDLKTKEDRIEVLQYPRLLANIYHVKLLISDGKSALVSGMNLSNHSAANWDMGVHIEGPEVHNLQAETFHQDWIVSKFWQEQFTQRQWPIKSIFKYLPHIPKNQEDQRILKSIRESLPDVKPVEDPAFQILNTMPREYGFFLGDTSKTGMAKPYGRSEIETFFQDTLKRDDLAGIDAEQFIACHKNMGQQLIDLAQNKKIPIKIVHSSSVIKKFPYTRLVVDQLSQAELLKYYPENQTIKERLHAKLTVFTLKNGKKLNYVTVLGSANTSEAAFKTLVQEGDRRGNRDLAIAIPNDKLGKTFLEQINIDWNYSLRRRPSGYGIANIMETLKSKLKPQTKTKPDPETLIKQAGLPLQLTKADGI